MPANDWLLLQLILPTRRLGLFINWIPRDAANPLGMAR